MWKKAEGYKSSSDSEDLNTKVLEEEDCMVFETEADDIDFDEVNDNEALNIDPRNDHKNIIFNDL
jgi:hypothetical protein